jgi:hypothetical protein
MQEEFSRAGLGSCGDFNRAFDMLLTLKLAKIEALIPNFASDHPFYHAGCLGYFSHPAWTSIRLNASISAFARPFKSCA